MNESGISWESVDISAIPELFETAVVMGNPEEAEAFCTAAVEFGKVRFGGLCNESAWRTQSFNNFTPDAREAMAIDRIGNHDVGLFYADADYYESDGYKLIDFSEIYITEDTDLDESQTPIEDLWR